MCVGLQSPTHIKFYSLTSESRTRQSKASVKAPPSWEMLRPLAAHYANILGCGLIPGWLLGHQWAARWRKRTSSFTKEEETGYWELTGNLCPNRHFEFWSSAFALFPVASVSLANDLVIQVSRASSFSKELNIRPLSSR